MENVKTQSTNQQPTPSTDISTIDVNGVKINRRDLIDQVKGQYNSFFNNYKSNWSKKQQQQILSQRDAIVKNLEDGNITRIGDNIIDLADINKSGIDQTDNGAGQINVGYLSKIGKWMANQVKANTPHKQFTNTTLNDSWMNQFFGGSSTPDLQSWLDLDKANDKGERTKTGRIAALNKWLNSFNINDYTEADSNLGDIESVKAKYNRLKTALNDGTINNEDYMAANALGLNLRTLLADDMQMPGDTTQQNSNSTQNNDSTQNASSSNTTTTQNAQTPVEELIYGKNQESSNTEAKQFVDRILRRYNDNPNLYGQKVSPSSLRPLQYITNGKVDVNRTNGVVNNILKSYGFNTTGQYLDWIGTNVFKKGIGEYYNYYRDRVVDPDRYYATTKRKLWGVKPRFGQLFGVVMKNYANDVVNGKVQGASAYTYNGHPVVIVPNSLNEHTGAYVIYDTVTGLLYNENLVNSNITDSSGLTPLQLYLNTKYPTLYAQQQQQDQNATPSQKNGGILKAQFGSPINYQMQGTLSTPPTKAKVAQQRAKQIEQLKELKRQNANNKKVNKLGDISGSDWARIAALGQDLVGTGAAYVPVLGTATSGALGVTSTLTNLGADIADVANGTLSIGDLAKNLGTNAALSAVSLIPGANIASTTGKIVRAGKTLVKLVPFLLAAGAANDVVSSFKKIGTGNLTEGDVKNILYGIQLTLAGGKSVGHTYKNIRYKGERDAIKGATRTMQEVSVKNNGTDVKVRLTPKQLKSVNKARTQTQANARLQQALADNGVTETSNYKVTEGLFPEKASLNPFNKPKLTGTKVTENLGSNMKSDAWYTNQDYLKNHPTLSKWFRRDYDIFVNGKSPVTIPMGLPNWSFGTKPTYNRAKAEQAANTAKNTITNASTVAPQSTSTGGSSTSAVTGASTVAPQSTSTGGSSTSAVTGASTVAPQSTSTGGSSTSASVVFFPELRDQIQDIFHITKPSEVDGGSIITTGINKPSLKEFIKNQPVDKLDKQSKIFIDNILNGKISDTKAVRKNLLQVLTKLISAPTFTNTFNRDAIAANAKALSSIKYKHGGILKAQNGTQFTPQVFGKYGDRTYGGINNTNNNTTWYNNVFSPYQDYIISQLKAYGNSNDYGNWLNNMQVQHYNLYNAAGGSNGNFLNTAYNNNADNVKKYQSDYDLDTLSKNPIAHGYNTRGIAIASQNNRYSNIGNTKRNGQDSLHTNWTPDGSYSGQTDDRRILGRKGDFTNQQLMDWNNKLKATGWEQYLDSNGYYQLRRSTVPQVNTNNKGQIVGANATGLSKDHTLEDILGGLQKNKGAILGALRAAENNQYNKRELNKYLSSLNPVLLNPYTFERRIYGDYATQQEYNRQGLNAQATSNRIAGNTADSYLGAASQLQGNMQAEEAAIKGRLADNDMIRKTYEASLNENKNNLAILNDIANKNKLALNNNERERANIEAATAKTNHDNWDRWFQNNYELPTLLNDKKRQAIKDYIEFAQVRNKFDNAQQIGINNIRQAYMKKYDAAKTDEERNQIGREMIAEMSKVQQNAQNDLLKELAKLRGVDYNFPTPEWEASGTYSVATPTYKKSGGILSTMLKETNKTNDRIAKQWEKSLDNFWKQYSKMRQAKYTK